MDPGPATDDRELSPGRRLAAHVAVVVASVAAVGGLVMLLAQRNTALPAATEQIVSDHTFLVSRAVSALLFAAAGWYLTTRRPGVVFGPLALAAGVGNGLAVLGIELAVYSEIAGHHLPAASVALWVGNWGLAVEPVVLAAIYVLFPDGTWPTGILRWVGMLSVALCTAGLLHSIVSPAPVDPASPFANLHNPLGLSVLPDLNDVVLIFPGLLLSSIVLVVRWLRATGELRLVLRSLSVITLLSWLPLVTASGSQGPEVAGEFFVVLTLVVVIAGALRRRVYGIEVILNRTLVYACLTAVVAAVYGALVGVVNLLGSQVGVGWGLVPAIGAAFSLFPARQRVQRLVNRFLYGQRDDPYAVVTRIGARLEVAGSTDHLLPDLLESIVNALRLPYAAIDLRADDGSIRHIESGTPTVGLDRFPLVHQGRHLGELVVGRRAGQSTVPPGERRLLEDIARQAAVAASNVMLTQELLRSRERIINAAEEERRRLRRDLHDGLGPVLTAAATRVDASRNLIRRDTDRADELLRDVRADLTSALADLRRLVYALRPPALDELGLIGAVREHVRRSAVPVVLQVPDALPPLPPAVEVAAYRIVAEAVTNVSRHAAASSCTVVIGCDNQLLIEVCDNGRATAAWAPGVGLTSMRERAMELGGRWAAGPGPDGGGRVLVELPVTPGLATA